MKELLLQYAEYNVWANKKMVDSLLQLTEGQVNREIISSFLSISKTVHHIMAAEHTWLQRLQLVEHPVWVGNSFEGSFADACAFWENASHEMLAYAASCNSDTIATELCYKDRSGNEYSTPVNEVLHHVFNHSTYHRGATGHHGSAMWYDKCTGNGFYIICQVEERLSLAVVYIKQKRQVCTRRFNYLTY